jgi:acetoin utilization deacetylase AcuC-like enzyme
MDVSAALSSSTPQRCSEVIYFSIVLTEINGGDIENDLNAAGTSVVRVLVAEGYIDERLRAVPPELVEAVSTKGDWSKYLELHGGPLADAARRREDEVLAALGLLEEARRRGKAVVATYPPRGVGYSSGRGGLLNAVAYLAKELEAAVVSLDAHFPWGTWELHLRLGFPFLAIYSGADGPHPGRLARRSDRVVAVPLPPGASDRSVETALDLAGRLRRPLVLEVGLDLYRLEPLGHFFATTASYHAAGRLIAEGGYIVLDCASAASIPALRALLAGADGAPNPLPERPIEESPAVVREVDRAVEKARERMAIIDISKKRHA